MLFDLKGKRKRVVQGTYLFLALLMGGGLVLFGIGGDVSGGLFDAIGGGSGGGGGNLVKDRIEKAEKRVQANPRDVASLKILIRDNYSLANDEADPNTGVIGQGGRDELQNSSQAWQRYLAATDKPETGLAQIMVQVYGPTALNDPKKGMRAAEIVAESQNSAQAYLQLTQFAALSGQSRIADLAGQKAVDLAPKDQRSSVKQQVEQLKTQAAGAGAGAQGSNKDQK
jgi:hypothetical protein